MIHEAIYKLNPSIKKICDPDLDAYDIDGNPVDYDLEAAKTEVNRMQAEKTAALQAQADAKQSALNKLMALGLTEEEALALGVK